MKSVRFGSDILLLITSLIWGFGFVAQRAGMAYVGPFTFNAIRFFLGGLSLVPLVLYFRGRESGLPLPGEEPPLRSMIGRGALIGLVLFAGASMQQIGLVYTTAGKAGFITGLYVVIVPIMWRFLGRKSRIGTWVGAIMAALGLYFLSVSENLTIQPGDMFVTIGAFFWAAHVILIGHFSRRIQPIYLSMIQFFFCAFFSSSVALVFEQIQINTIRMALVPILYGGLISVGIAYTLQVVAQKYTHPAHAAILLSLESVFAALGGWLVLNEVLSSRSKVGCGLMFIGMLASQIRIKRSNTG